MMNRGDFNRLDEVIDGVVNEINKRDIVLAERGGREEVAARIVLSGHLAYCTHRSFDFKVLSVKGTPTKKYFHATIWRLDNGRYELNTYML